MSDTDSFINEVTDEVKRDRLFAQMRKYAPYAVAAVVFIVGGAAWTEYKSAKDAATAQAAGDAIYAALEESDVAARADVLDNIVVEGDAQIVTQMLAAAAFVDAENLPSAIAILQDVAQNGDYPKHYRDLAAFKAALLIEDPAEKLMVLTPLSAPGQPYYLLAMEQMAYAQLAQGDQDTALETLQRIAEDAASTRTLRERAQNVMIALGAPMPEPVSE